MNGKFIVFEGPDGSGKTTIIKKVKELLENKDYSISYYREPGGTSISEKIRSIIIDNDNYMMDAKTEALLFASSRAQLVAEKITPDLKEGKIVICDRFVMSSLLYQGLGRALGVDNIKTINDFATGGLKPDLTLFFNIDYKTALERKRANFSPDRLENEDFSFHKTIFDGYMKMADLYKDEIKKVDARKSIEDLTEDVINIIYQLLEDWDEIIGCYSTRCRCEFFNWCSYWRRVQDNQVIYLRWFLKEGKHNTFDRCWRSKTWWCSSLDWKKLQEEKYNHNNYKSNWRKFANKLNSTYRNKCGWGYYFYNWCRTIYTTMSILDNQLKNNSLSNAYIIEGEDLAYNLEYAKDFAKKVFASYGFTGNIDTNPDLEIIDKDIIDIATIRSLIKDMVIRPINNKIKIYIIQNAQNLRQESSNAMLKSLEELKSYSLIIFTVDNRGKIIPTIRSRCQLISLNTVNTNLNVDMDRLSEIFAKVYDGDLSTFYKERDFLLNFKEDKASFMEALIKILSDIVDNKYLAKIGNSTYAYNIESLSKLDLTKIEKLLAKFEQIYGSFKNNVNFELSVDNIFLNIYREGRNS